MRCRQSGRLIESVAPKAQARANSRVVGLAVPTLCQPPNRLGLLLRAMFPVLLIFVLVRVIILVFLFIVVLVRVLILVFLFIFAIFLSACWGRRRWRWRWYRSPGWWGWWRRSRRRPSW